MRVYVNQCKLLTTGTELRAVIHQTLGNYICTHIILGWRKEHFVHAVCFVAAEVTLLRWWLEFCIIGSWVCSSLTGSLAENLAL